MYSSYHRSHLYLKDIEILLLYSHQNDIHEYVFTLLCLGLRVLESIRIIDRIVNNEYKVMRNSTRDYITHIL